MKYTRDDINVGDEVITYGYSDLYDGKILTISDINKNGDENTYCYFECPEGMEYKWSRGHNFEIRNIKEKLNSNYEIY